MCLLLVGVVLRCAGSENAPTIIFMDEVDSIGSSRVEGSRGGDSEVQRTMLELLNQLDGFEPTQNIKVTSCVWCACLRPGHGTALPGC